MLVACCYPLSLSLALSISLYRTPPAISLRSSVLLFHPSPLPISPRLPHIVYHHPHPLPNPYPEPKPYPNTTELCALLLSHNISSPLPSSIISPLLYPFLFLLLGVAPPLTPRMRARDRKPPPPPLAWSLLKIQEEQLKVSKRTKDRLEELMASSFKTPPPESNNLGLKLVIVFLAISFGFSLATTYGCACTCSSFNV